MEGVPHGDRLVTAGGNACELKSNADGSGATWAQEHLVEVTRGDLCQLPGQIHGDAVGITPGAK